MRPSSVIALTAAGIAVVGAGAFVTRDLLTTKRRLATATAELSAQKEIALRQAQARAPKKKKKKAFGKILGTVAKLGLGAATGGASLAITGLAIAVCCASTITAGGCSAQGAFQGAGSIARPGDPLFPQGSTAQTQTTGDHSRSVDPGVKKNE